MKNNLFTDCTMCELCIQNESDIWIVFWGIALMVFVFLWCIINLDFSVIPIFRITASRWFKMNRKS